MTQAEKMHEAYGHLKSDGLMDDDKRNEYEALELRQAGYQTSEKLLESLKQGGKFIKFYVFLAINQLLFYLQNTSRYC